MSQISVILPNYNYARFLPQRIESILNQTYSDFELIIIDDASTDNSEEIIDKYKRKDARIKTIYNKVNSGNPFVQWKKGIEIAKGEYIWIAEADDYCLENFLENLLKLFNSEKNVAIAYSQSNVVDEKGEIIGYWNKLKMEAERSITFNKDFFQQGIPFIEQFLIYQNVIPNASAVLFKKETYAEVGGIDTSLNFCADWLLWLKILTFYSVAYTSAALNFFRRHENSVINSSKEIIEEKGDFHEFYSSSMRLKYQKWLKGHRNIKRKNGKYIAKDLGNKIKWEKRQKNIFAAIKNSLDAFYYSGGDINYLKRLIK